MVGCTIDAAAPDRFFKAEAVHLDAAADAHVVDRDTGVLAEEVLRVLGHPDILDHGSERAFRAGVRLARREPVEALLDVGRQQLQRPDIELLGGVLDLLQIDFHSTLIFRSRTTRAQRAVSAFIAAPISSGVLPTGASPWT